MYKVGLTGGIGSGKTTIGKIFENLGVPVYNSDNRARVLINEHPQIIEAYKLFFGSDIYNNGNLNKARVASILFTNRDLLKKIEKIVHPIVYADFEKWVGTQNSRVVIKEAAVLFESGGQKSVDDVITVTAPIDVRIQRVIKRNGFTRQEIISRINNQWSDKKKIALSKYVIYADESQLVVLYI